MKIVISGTGLFTPPDAISNAELVDTYNQFVRAYNTQHQAEIIANTIVPLAESSSEFIEKASGIKNRYVMSKAGILDPTLMRPSFPKRSNDELSIQAEMAVNAANAALSNAHKRANDIDAVIVACSGFQRAYPAIAIEVQQALGIQGFAFDMNTACSSATFAIQAATDIIARQHARAVLVVCPEFASPQVNFRDRQSHFIFGDAAVAIVIEKAEYCKALYPFEVIDTRLKTVFSNNIRCNFGFLNRIETGAINEGDQFFSQDGRHVFKEVVPMVVEFIHQHLVDAGIEIANTKRLWLHQANSNMNRLIASKLLGYEASAEQAPTILDEYANTGCAGSIIAFHKHHQNLHADDLGILCSFGAGYSAGNIILRKLA